ncbi:MAG: type II toxin-antitoxin system YafQ family toxin [Sulfurovum sp.]|nr:type II toxin-antitoxin system YafQ family toxin [Sulfurovum sp.]
MEEKELPSEALDHSLDGQWSQYREFHISGDLLVIYKIADSILYLARIGTHAQLFK